MENNFKDDVQIEDWLETQPSDVVAVFEARASLRGLPYIFDFKRIRNSRTSLEAAVLSYLWVSASALAIGIWPEKRAALNRKRPTVSSATVSSSDTAVAAYSHAFDHADPDSDIDAISTIMAEYSADRDYIEAGASAKDLSRQNLWQRSLVSYRGLPLDVDENWERLKTGLLSLRGQAWKVWTQWYEARLRGEPLIEGLEIGVVNGVEGSRKNALRVKIPGRLTFPAADYQNPRIVNPKIGAMIEAYEGLPDAQEDDEALDIESLVVATPLAEEIVIRDDGKFHVEFLPTRDLFDKNLARIFNALNKALGANAFNPNSEEILYLQEMLESHADDPQRIHDDCDFIHSEIAALVRQEVVPDSFAVKRLQNSISQTVIDIRAYEPKVLEVIQTRDKLNIDTNVTPNEKSILESEKAIEPILSERLKLEIGKGVNELLGVVGLADKGQALYKLMSRCSRMHQKITEIASATVVSETEKLALISAQPHLARLIETLRPLFSLMGIPL